MWCLYLFFFWWGGMEQGFYHPARCLPWGLVTGLMLPGYFLPGFELKWGWICAVIKRFLCSSLCLALVAAGLDPLSLSPFPGELQLSCLTSWAASSSEKLWLVSVNRNKWLWSLANFNSALFLLGLHNFNDQEVKHAVKQNQNLRFQMQF